MRREKCGIPLWDGGKKFCQFESAMTEFVLKLRQAKIIINMHLKNGKIKSS